MSSNWEEIQQRTFTRWVNAQLKKKGTKVEDLLKDFEDGLKLIQLFEIISDTSLGKYNKNPRMRIQKIENLSIVVGEVNNFAKSVGIKVKFSAEQVTDGDKRTILGMIWVLIHKFAIQDISEESMHAKDGLLLWCQKKTKDYNNVKVENFTKSWRNGLAFCALIHKHRPDLIDYDSLDPKNMEQNLQLAFDVAEKDLDIPSLLDAKDVADSERPDEKSVMTYVAYFWKKFASENKQQKSINMISRLGQKMAENQKVIHDYEERSKKLVSWTGEKTEKYSDCSNLGDTLEAVMELYSKFKEYKNDEKPPQISEKSDLEIMLKSLRTKQKNDGLEVYSPPEELSTDSINGVWKKLGETQDEYEKALKARIGLMKNLEQLLDRFNGRSKRLEDWEKSKKEGELSEDIEKLQTIPSIQSKIKTMDTFENQVETQKKNFVETKQIGQKVIDGGHAAAPNVKEKTNTCETGLEEIEKLTKDFKDKLDELLKKKQLIEKLSIEFGNAVQQLNLVADDATNSLFDSVASASVEEVDKKIDTNSNCVQRLEDSKSLLDQLTDLDKQITELGADPAAFSSLNLEQAKSKHETTSTKIGERKDELAKEKERQLEILKMLDKWNTMAGGFVQYCEDQTKDLNQIESGSPKSQLESFKSRSDKVQPESTEKFKECDEYYSSLDNDVISRVQVSLESVSVSKDGVENIINRKTEELEKKIKFLEKTSNDFKTKTTKVETFYSTKKEYFASVDSKATTINAIQAELRFIDTFKPEFKGIKNTFSEAEKLGKILIDNLDESSSEVEETMNKLKSGIEEISTSISENKTKLEELLKVKQQIEEKSNQFANEVAALNLVLEDAKTFLDEPVSSSSVDEAQTKIDLNAGHATKLEENKSSMETISNLDKEIKELGGDSSVYASLKCDEITEKYNSVSSKVEERKTELEKEKELQEELTKLVLSWDEKAQKFVDECTTQKSELEKPDEGSPKTQLESFKTRSAEPVESSKKQLGELEEMFKEIQSKDVASRISVALRNVTVAQNSLESYVKRKTLELDQTRKELERSLIKLKIRFDKIKTYSEDKNKSLDSLVAKSDTIGAIQASIQNLSGFENEFKGIQNAFATTEKMGIDFIESKHEKGDVVQGMIDTSKETLTNLESRVKEVDEELKKKLADKQATEELCINFSKAAQTLDVYLEDLGASLSEKINVSSVEEVEEIATSTDALEKEYAEKETSVTEMSGIHKEITDKGENPQTYTNLKLDDLSSKYTSLKDEFSTKKESIEAEKKVQEENVKLIQDFTSEYSEFQSYVSKTSDEVEKLTEGSLEEQLKQVKELSTKVKPESKSSAEKLCASFEKVESANIAEQAPATIQEINGLNAQLEKVIDKRIETLESGILSQKQSGISEEQLKDFRDTFKFFDKENTGSLTKFPFKAACAAAGEDIPDEELEKVFAEFDTDKDGKISFDEFISFISSVAKEGAGKSDLMTAFSEIAGGKDFITEQQITSNFDKAQAEHFLSAMKKTDDGYDYKAYLESSFSS